MVLDYHKLEDKLREASLGKNKIGTTARGIGPCYADKIGRSYALRMADLRNLDRLKEKLKKIIDYKNKLFGALYNADPINLDDIYAQCTEHSEILKPFICNTTQYLYEAIDANKQILFEGAQGALLDLDHGTFPFVTSSNASALGLGPGCGVPSKYIQRASAWSRLIPPASVKAPSPLSRTMKSAGSFAKGSRIRHDHRSAAALRLV